MSKGQKLRALVNERLTAAAAEIFELFERTIAEYEQEVLRFKQTNDTQQQLLAAVLEPTLHSHTTGVQIVAVSQEEVSPGVEPETAEDREDGHGEAWSWEPLTEEESVSMKEPRTGVQIVEPAHIKEEPELCIKQEEEQLQEFPFAPVCVKPENNEDKSSVLHQRATEENREETNGEDCGAEAGCSSDPLTQLHSDSEEHTVDHSEDWTRNKPSLKRVYANHKRYQCSECGKGFVRNAELQRHVLIHTGQRPFKCSVCGRGFRVVYQLQTHMRTHTGEKTCFCLVCNKGFTTKSLLTEHMRVHTGDKPFRCPVCNKGFTQRGNVRAHVRTHTGEKPYCCHLCKRCFTQKSTLIKHATTHRREKQAVLQHSRYISLSN